MPNSATAVQDALAETLASTEDGADSQSATEPSTDVAAALNDALKTGGKSATADTAIDDGTSDGKEPPKTVPYDRLKTVVGQKNEISERFNALEEKFNAAHTREQELRTRIGEMEKDSQILDAIKNLYQDEKYRPHVQAIDNALQGIEEEVVEAQAEGNPVAESVATQKLEAKTKELESLLADQRAEGLWDKAHGLAKDMLAALPDQYSDEDRALIGKLWTPRVDWAGIERAGSEAIPSALNTTLAEVIREYGTPKGAIAAKTTEEIESRIPEAKVLSPEDKVKSILEKNWAEVDKDGTPLMSESDFNNGMAELLRATRNG